MKPIEFLQIWKRDVMNGADISSRLDMEDEQMWNIKDDVPVSGLRTVKISFL